MNEMTNESPQKSFWQDTAECWQRLPNKAFFFVLLGGWLLLFQFFGNPILGYVHSPSIFTWMMSQYNRPESDDSHGPLVPFLVVGIFWWKRHELLGLPLKMWTPGLPILVLAMAMQIFGYLIQQPYITIAAMFTGVWALMGLAWGPQWLRYSLFPFVLFVFCVPLGAHGQVITFPLQQLVSWLTEKVAHVLGVDVVRVGTQLFDPSGSYGYEVAAACSGIRSLVVVFLLATTYGFIAFDTWRQRLLLIALAVPFAILGNLLRMVLIIMVAALVSFDAGNYIHASPIFSVLPYVPAIAGFLLMGRWLERREEKKSSA